MEVDLTGSYIWMFASQMVEMFGKDEGVCLDGGDVSLGMGF